MSHTLCGVTLLPLWWFVVLDVDFFCWDTANASPYTLDFQLPVPATGFTTFFVEQVSAPSLRSTGSNPPAQPRPAGSTNTIQNEFYRITFDTTTGRATTIENLVSGITSPFKQEWYWYNSSASGNGFSAEYSTQNSGAYIFRPNSSDPYIVQPGNVELTITSTNVVQEAVQVWNSSWLQQRVRLYQGRPYVEIEFTVGPVPFHDGFVRCMASLGGGGTQVCTMCRAVYCQPFLPLCWSAGVVLWFLVFHSPPCWCVMLSITAGPRGDHQVHD